jgi:hypothetical protein
MRIGKRGRALGCGWLVLAGVGWFGADALAACANGADLDCDGLSNGIDLCPFFASADQRDTDGNGIGSVCECGDQNGDGTVNVADLLGINQAIFDPARVTLLCDANGDGLCNVSDIVAANFKIFGRRAYCSRYPAPRANLVVGSQQFDVLRAPTRLFESAMGNLVADAMRLEYPGVDGALTNSGGLRADLLFSQVSAGEQPGEITWGELFAVHPFGNRIVLLTLTGAQLQTALLNGLSPFCNPAIPTGRFPQVSGLRVRFSCSGTTTMIVGLWNSSGIPIGPADAVRIATNDFMFTGGDGYTVLALGTNVQQPPAELLQILTEYVTATSPVAPVVQGRIIGP